VATFHGVGISWGVDSTISSVNGAFESRDHSYSSESELIKDGGETTVSKVYWDFSEEAIFTYVAIQPGSYPFGDAPVYAPNISDFVTIYDGRYPRINGEWLVDAVTTRSSNTSAVRVTLKLSRFPYLLRL
jgi:hypothetical protein